MGEKYTWSDWCKDTEHFRKEGGRLKVDLEDLEPFIIFELHDKYKAAEEFYSKNPYFFDETQTFWLWDYELSCYVKVDKTGILRRLEDFTPYKKYITSRQQRQEMIYGLQQVGRKNVPRVPEKEWVQFRDMVVDMRTGERFKASHKYFFANPIPWNVGESEETPMMDKIFKEWVFKEGVQDESYVTTLYEIIAYSTLACQPAQRMFALTGAGSNGKSIYQDLIIKFVGENNICTTTMDLLTTNNFASSQLFKKLVAIMGEVNAHDLKNTKLIKQLSGGDMIRYEFKGKTPISAYSYTTCIIATNTLPSTPDRSVGFYRRWLIIDFPNQFPLKKDIIGSIPEKEFENLSFKCIKHCMKILNDKEFTNEGNIEERTRKYEYRSNPLAHFLQEMTMEDPNSEILYKDLFKEFDKFLIKHNHRRINKVTLSKLLKLEGFITEKTSVAGVVGIYILGIKWKP